MSTANIGPLAPFRYTCASDTWWWSDQAFRIFGFAPAEVVPTTDLILRHLHPDDVDSAVDWGRRQLARQEGFCLWFRVVDARRKVRQVLAVGEGVWNGAGEECEEIHGSLLDVTRALRISYAQDVDEAVRAAARTRAAIEQAKGVLMFTHKVSAEEAFEALRRCSQATNVKVRDVAESVMAAVVEAGQLPSPVRRHLQEVAGSVGRRRTIPASLADGSRIGSYDGHDGLYDGLGGSLDGLGGSLDGDGGSVDGDGGSVDGDERGRGGHNADDPVS